MSHGHVNYVCESCGARLGGCRCMEPNKPDVKMGLCPACAAKPAMPPTNQPKDRADEIAEKWTSWKYSAELAAEIRAYGDERAAVLRRAIIAHRSQKADDRCVEDDRLYEALGDGIKCDRRVGSKEEMLKNCARFIDRRCEGGHWPPTYQELEAKAQAEQLNGALALARRIAAVLDAAVKERK